MSYSKSQEEMNLSTGYVPVDFSPRRGLRSGHVQTIASHFLPRANGLPSPERRTFQVADGVQVVGLCNWQPERAEALTVVLVHGLEGSGESQYIIGTANKAWRAGMNVVRMNVRNCGGTEALSCTLYHSGMSEDIGIVIRELITAEGLKSIALAGYSMGGNQVLKLAGEWGGGLQGGTPPELRAVAAISPAMDLSLSADALHLRSNRIYELRFLVSLRARLRRKLRLFPGKLNAGKMWWKSIREFDDTVTAPNCGFRDAEDYYTQASASRVVEDIAVPTLIINSKDDPFVRVSEATLARVRANSNITFVETEHGGHCAFLAAANGYDGRWAEREIVEFFAVKYISNRSR